jgi:uncharacterized membrane protein YbhN (UPF0104 family)
VKKYKKLIGILSLAVSGSLVGWLLLRMDWVSAKKVWDSARLIYLLWALLITGLIPMASVMRWQGVLRAQATGLPFGVALRAVLMANVLNSIIPSKGGDLIKALYLKNHGGIATGMGTVALERLVDLFILGMLGVMGFFVSQARWGLWAGLVLMGGVSIVLVLALFLPLAHFRLPPNLKTKLEDFTRVFRTWVRQPRAIIQTVLASIFVWVCAGLSVVCLCLAFHADVSSGYTFAIFPLCILAGLLPVTLSGIGTRDVAFVKLLMAAGVTLEKATMVGFGYTVFAYWILSLISLPAVGWQMIQTLKSRPSGNDDGRVK